MAKKLHEPSYKTTELFKYEVTKKIDGISKKICAPSSDNSEEIMSYILSAVISFTVAAVFSDDLKNTSFLFRILIVLGIIILYFIAQKLILKIAKVRKSDKNYNLSATGRKLNSDSKSKKELIDDFDNYVCDFLLIAYDFKYKYEETDYNETDSVIMDFYYFEMIYYSVKASTMLISIINKAEDSNECWIAETKSDIGKGGISVYRIENILLIFREILVFLYTNKKLYEKKYLENEVLLKEIANLKQAFNFIAERNIIIKNCKSVKPFET